MDNLYKQQLKLQSQTIELFQQKIEKNIAKKEKNVVRSKEDTFSKLYLKKMAKQIHELQAKHLSAVIGKIYKHNDYKNILQTFFSSDTKEYLLEDRAKEIALVILEQINSTKSFTKKSLEKHTYEILKELNIDLETSIKKLNLTKKEQKMALATILLSSGETTWLALQSISNLTSKNLQDNEDESTSSQNIINSIAENIFEHIAFRFKKEKIYIQDWENDTEIDVAMRFFSFLIDLEILQEYEKESGRMKYFMLSEDFIKKSKNIYKNMSEYYPPSFEPMIVQPTPWKDIDDGGFIKDKNSSPKFDLYIMKATTKKDRENIRKEKGEFSDKLLRAINIIQNTKWHINKELLTYANIEFERQKEENKEKVKALEKQKRDKHKEYREFRLKVKSQKELLQEMGMQEKEVDTKLSSKYKEQKSLKLKYDNKLIEINKIKNLQNIQEQILKIAKKYESYNEIFFVWQIDFRGRAYPVQPLLNPQGEDIAKSLLRFPQKKPLGTHGEKWFKIHGANVYGQDKVSFEDRVKWVDKHREEILNIFSYENPFLSPFLQKADKRYSFLAFACEYKEYVESSEDFQSALPIAMDGSNNGFQHITALLRDKKGAELVNVLPLENQKVPSDIYKKIADKTKSIIDSELLEEPLNRLIQTIYPYIDRSFTKKNVMTEVYGAGKKAKLQQIKEYIENKLQPKLEWSNEEVNRVSLYLRDTIANAMAQELTSSSTYKKWMKKIANEISKQNRGIIWHTPIIEFKILQEEFETKTDRISTKYNANKHSIQIRISTDKINKSAQAQSIAPNFIHSLDATHMFLSILQANERGVSSFSTIHDSFATHACNIDILLESVKESFVQMHQLDILEKFRQEIISIYNLEIKKMNYINEDFDFDEIKKSKYIFS